MEQEIEGLIVLRKITPLGISHNISELFGKHIEITLVSGDVVDAETRRGKTYDKGQVEWNPLAATEHLDTTFKLKFKWRSSLGVPGAFLIKNRHPEVFFLRLLTIDLPEGGSLQFRCNSWIYPSENDSQRIFFSNKSYLPGDTPPGLQELRSKDLADLRGTGNEERHTSDRIYDYDFYNDLGDPDSDAKLKRPVLGGSREFPYPRRCRTGRRRSKSDPSAESRGSYPLFIPPDERFPFEDFTDFGVDTLMSFASTILPAILKGSQKEFKSFEDVQDIYEKDINNLGNSKSILAFVKQLIDPTDGSPLSHLNIPDIIAVNTLAWKTDEEFARQTIAGVNPLVIQCLQEFPPVSKLDPQQFGPQKSTISSHHIEKYLEGLALEKAVAAKRLFIIDYYDVYMPYVERINKLSSNANEGYATRTLFYLNKQGALKPIAIELCLPPTQNSNHPLRQVCTPAEEGTDEGALWLLAKAHARGNDAGYHQLVSHWLQTHCVLEPIIIATHRQLSMMHPLYKLLVPHYLNTMDINQAARIALINAGGIIENGFTPGKYSMELSSKAYMDWKFVEQGLPADLIKRGMAKLDTESPHGLRLAIEDYPYAVDGLEIWSALKKWVSDYVHLFYKTDESVKTDTELKAWWDEIVTVAHGDLQQDPSVFYKMISRHELIEALTTLIWTASAHHSAVNFGQYPYGGYMPNLPTMTRRLLPQKGTKDYEEMLQNVNDYFLKTVTDPIQTLIITAVLHILANHAKNEVYIGQLQGSTPEWTAEKQVEEAFGTFSAALAEIEKNVNARNEDPKLPNRVGPAQLRYTLLYPDTTDLSRKGGVTGRGVSNSTSI